MPQYRVIMEYVKSDGEADVCEYPIEARDFKAFRKAALLLAQALGMKAIKWRRIKENEDGTN